MAGGCAAISNECPKFIHIFEPWDTKAFKNRSVSEVFAETSVSWGWQEWFCFMRVSDLPTVNDDEPSPRNSSVDTTKA